MTCRGEEIAAVLKRKLQAVEEFGLVTGALRAALESGEMNEVSRCIERRADLIRDIEGLDRQIDRSRRMAPADRRPEIEGLLTDMSGKLGDTLRCALAIDRECTAIASQTHEETRRELAAIRHQKRGVHGYVLKTDRKPRFPSVHT